MAETNAPQADKAKSSRRYPVRRVPRPKITHPFDSPIRNLVGGIIVIVTIMVLAIVAYMSQGWRFSDALYMVIITVYTVGYEEVLPITTPALRVITDMLVVLGCTSMIFLTGALVQFFTFNQINRAIGQKRMNAQIDQLKGHVIICGFGRLGEMLARSLHASSAGFVIVEADEVRVQEARAAGYLCIQYDATDETGLHAAGINRAHALACVLSNDALNVFITLSARALNSTLSIVARAEQATTESKLIQAGADKVIMPTHIGAERIAELLLHAESARFLEGLERSHGFQRVLHGFGIELEVITAAPQSQAVGMSVAVLERQAKGAFFIVQINRSNGEIQMAPPATATLGEGDALVLIGRPNHYELLRSLFEPKQRMGVRG